MKKIHRFFVPSLPIEEVFSITDPAIVHQLSTVLGIKKGETIALFTSGSSDIVATIRAVDKKVIALEKINTKSALPSPSRSVIAAIAIAKGNNFELIVQKLTEIGVSEIVPLITQRTVKQSIRNERMRAISIEALEQSGRNVPVIIHEPKTITETLETFPYQSFVFSQDGTPAHTIPKAEKIVLYIGPEGGWNEAERTLFASRSISVVSLCPQTLRTETAAIVGAYTLLWN